MPDDIKFVGRAELYLEMNETKYALGFKITDAMTFRQLQCFLRDLGFAAQDTAREIMELDHRLDDTTRICDIG